MKQHQREFVPADTRRAMTKTRRAEVFLRCGGRCAYCGEKVGPLWDVDHAHALELGGRDVIENLVVACKPCHRAKTDGHDAPAIAKVRRQQKMAEAEPTGSIRGRGFGDRHKGFDGVVRLAKRAQRSAGRCSPDNLSLRPTEQTRHKASTSPSAPDASEGDRT